MTETRSNTSLSADTIMALREETKAMPTLMAGVLDDKIDELKAQQAKADQASTAAQATLQELATAQKAVAADRAKLEKDKADFAATKKTDEASSADRRASLDSKAQQLIAQEAALTDARATLQSDQSKFNARLEALKLPA